MPLSLAERVLQASYSHMPLGQAGAQRGLSRSFKAALNDFQAKYPAPNLLPRPPSGPGSQGGKVALLLIDLDNFKLVNDFLGHQGRDRVLREVAERLKRCLGEADTAARIGGDELAVLLDDVADASGAVRLAHRFHAQLRVTFDVAEYRFYTSATIGIAVAAREPPEKLVRAADLAMYQAKRTGKGRSVVFDPSSITDSST